MNRSDEVVVNGHGRVTAAQHVYARDRMVQLRRLVPASSFWSTVSIVVSAIPDDGVSASGEVHVDGHVWRARAEGPTISLAIDRLHEQLREYIEQSRHETTDGSGDGSEGR